jgi:predicted ArsR family transcriptional regulator
MERATLDVLIALTGKLARTPTAEEVSAELGLVKAGAKKHIDKLTALNLYSPFTELNEQQVACLRAIVKLQRELGRAPGSREVSAEMGLSPGGSRIHIETLIRFGLIIPPQALFVITAAGQRFL